MTSLQVATLGPSGGVAALSHGGLGSFMKFLTFARVLVAGFRLVKEQLSGQ